MSKALKNKVMYKTVKFHDHKLVPFLIAGAQRAALKSLSFHSHVLAPLEQERTLHATKETCTSVVTDALVTVARKYSQPRHY